MFVRTVLFRQLLTLLQRHCGCTMHCAVHTCGNAVHQAGPVSAAWTDYMVDCGQTVHHDVPPRGRSTVVNAHAPTGGFHSNAPSRTLAMKRGQRVPALRTR